MLRQRFLLSGLVVLVLLLTVAGRVALPTRAQDTDAAPHPIIGSWHLESGFAPSMVTFHADGSYFEVDAEGSSGVGVWEATGERTAKMTAVYPSTDGNSKVRASFEVATDGQSFAAPFTLEVTLPDGTNTGEYGPGSATGTRLTVEPMGTPTGSIEDLFALFSEQPEGPVNADLEAYEIGWRTADEPGSGVTLTVTPGETIDVANVGAAMHNLTIETLDISVDLPPGESTTVTIPADATPGEYAFLCNVPGHAAAGMVGTLVIA
jgi:uncharacterized cupredoxin-like copper-binding protein